MVQAWDYGQGTAREVDWTQGQHLGRGWASARVPAHFSVRKAESRRERLQVERSGESLEVVNGLGAAITSLWMADTSGRLYQASGIAAGQKAQLTAAPESAGPAGDTGPAALRTDLAVTLFQDMSLSNAATYLAPGTYLATLDRNPFVENPLGPKATSARTRAIAVVYGVLEAQP
jgi:hypothetical protein